MKLVRAFRVLMLLLLIVLAACKRSAPATEAVVLPVVTDASTELVLTWIDDKGEFHVEQKVADVPAAARELVRVTDPNKEPKPGEVFVVDLRAPGPNGEYPVRVMTRAELEKVALDRRGGGALTPKPADSVLPAEVRPTVIIYGASWCGPCHQAAAFFKKHGVAFVEKDIEQDSSAAREMQAKLASAGMRGGSIPVIDVRGKMLVGFDEASIARALGI